VKSGSPRTQETLCRLHDFGASPRHGAHREDCEEGGGENDTIKDLRNFEDDENWLGFLVGGQLDDLEFWVK
jgi:hypothetical protein